MNQHTEQTELLRRLEEENAALKRQLQRSKDELHRVTAHRDFLESSYNMVVNSRGHRLMETYYNFRSKGLKGLFTKDSEAANLDPYACYQQLRFCHRIDILTTEHTTYIASLLHGFLLEAGVDSNIIVGQPDCYEDIPYIIICPSQFTAFPKVYAAFQTMSASPDSYFAEDYRQKLYNACAVFESSLENLDYFSKDPKLARKLFYMPFDLCEGLALETPAEKEYDVLLLGSEENEQIRSLISEKYKTCVVQIPHGDAFYESLRKAKLVLHFNDGEALLPDLARLYEILSVSDALIVSEALPACAEADRLQGILDEVPAGDANAMLARIDYWLEHETERAEKAAADRSLLRTRPNAAKFYLNRFLLANDRIGFQQFYDTVSDFVTFTGDRLCLSLPETTERRKDFDTDNKYGFEVFPGLKHQMGWIGCAMSYKFIFKKVQEKGLDQVLICEDDVYFPENFEERFAKALQYTASHDDWDIYEGIMADIGDAQLLDCLEENGETFVYVDRMISTVFNLYNKSIFQTIIDWDNTNLDAATNTIDRYLQAYPRRILTTDPFLVGHKEDMASIIWGSTNARYSDWITASSKKLHDMAEAFKQNNVQ